MRCIHIRFNGYKRLDNAHCNTDGKMIAFLGPNEAGKSSVLNALAWLSTGEGPLPGHLRTRSRSGASLHPVVDARFALDDADRAALDGLPIEGHPVEFTLQRMPDGSRRTGLAPKPTRAIAPFAAANEGLARVKTQFREELEPIFGDPETDDVEVPPALAWLGTAEKALADIEAHWNEEWDENFDNFTAWLRDDDEAMRDENDDPLPRASDVADALDQARAVLRAAHPEAEARQRILERAPEFALFDEADRTLSSRYDLEDANLRENPPKALANLVAVADLDINDLWTHIEGDDVARARTIERKANTQLSRRLGPKWRQEAIDVELRVNGTDLEVLVIETSDDGADTPIGERSDGLRIFVALVAFLARKDFTVPPILLVDEAETHLHYDAQADLVEVLTTDVAATQVFYTTHSPGCLPRDLGTGVRFVAPLKGRRDASELRNDFWTNERPGLSPLLFAMGAGAAAFSAFRKAVLAEGAADMILLPSLLRLATDGTDLGYQIAPGLANYNGSGIELEETAARVVYLLDGDPGGDKNKTNLTDLGIHEDRVFQLEPNKAPEDYVDRDRYLEVINTFVAPKPDDTKIDATDLADNIPISKAVADWCKERDIRAPGKTAVASALVADQRALRLAPDAADFLARLHQQLDAALSAPVTQKTR